MGIRVFYVLRHPPWPDLETGEATVLEPPTPAQGARRVWADSQGRIWASEWNARQVVVYDPALAAWQEWLLPGDSPRAYTVYVDEQDNVWLSDFDGNSLVRFDPQLESLELFTLFSPGTNVRQIWADQVRSGALSRVPTSWWLSV